MTAWWYQNDFFSYLFTVQIHGILCSRFHHCPPSPSLFLLRPLHYRYRIFRCFLISVRLRILSSHNRIIYHRHFTNSQILLSLLTTLVGFLDWIELNSLSLSISPPLCLCVSVCLAHIVQQYHNNILVSKQTTDKKTTTTKNESSSASASEHSIKYCGLQQQQSLFRLYNRAYTNVHNNNNR